MIEHIPQAPHPHQSCVFRTKERPNPRFSPVSTRFLPASQILHPLEESVRRRPPQRPKSSRHWRKIDAHEPLSGKNPPPTGRKWTHIGSPAGKILQTLEESVRHRPSQRPKSSTHWKNRYAHRTVSGKIVPVDGRIKTWTVLSRTWAEFIRIAATKKAYRALRALSVSLVGG